ncbi:hypothetical protein I4F81_001545 [Pyropia yezoensis]|uniref:Uncharacterized protein n=1 Tax=Pyropia yezoensis TaxID=2788 RepID=A0ACC3BLX0_PYRYE|nr:hypothetical protein I4F81_001545 [Neopyropia yezoensis]
MRIAAEHGLGDATARDMLRGAILPNAVRHPRRRRRLRKAGGEPVPLRAPGGAVLAPDAEELQLIHHLMRHAEAVYGNPIAAIGNPRAAMLGLTSERIVRLRTGVAVEDVRLIQMRNDTFRPAHYLAIDHRIRAVVVTSDASPGLAPRPLRRGSRLWRATSLDSSSPRWSRDRRSRPAAATAAESLAPADDAADLPRRATIGPATAATAGPPRGGAPFFGGALSSRSSALLGGVTPPTGGSDGGGAERVRGYAHTGILRSAHNLLSSIRGGLAAAAADHPTYRVVLTGHSLGGATAALLALLLADAGVLPASRLAAYAMGPPPCVTAGLAAAADRTVTCVVNGYDVIPRVSVVTLARLFAAIRYVMGLSRVAKVGVDLGLRRLVCPRRTR